MKLRSIILVLSVSLIACHNNSNKEATQEPFKIAADSSDYLPDHNSTHLNSPYDTTGILTQLLDPDSIVDNVAIWRPDAEAKFNMNVSEDGNCYTNIDTIIKFPDNGWPDYLVILTTYLCDSAGEHFGGHSCAVDYGMATIVKNDSSSEKREKVSDYKIYSFKRDLSHFGEYGQGAKVSVENFGEDVLRISDQYYGQGEEGTNDSYFSITDGDNVFSNFPYSSNAGAYITPAAGYEIAEHKLTTLPNKNGPWKKLKIDCKDTIFDTIKHKLIYKEYTEFYEMTENKNIYERVLK